MRFLRALLNSGVFMIILLAAATLYLVYSDAVKRDHGLMDESASGQSLASQVPAEDSQPVPVTPVTAVSAEPAQQAASAMAEPSATASEASEPAAVAEASAVQAVSEPASEEHPPMAAADRAMTEFPPMMPAPAMPPMPEPMMPPAMPAYGAPSHALVPQQVAEPMPAGQEQPYPSGLSVLETARVAFYQGDLAMAEQHYLQALAQSNDPDVQGELGNVYFAQQNLNKAVEHYAAAVDGLGKQGRFLQAQYVLGFVMQVSPEKGQQLLDGLRGQMYPQPPASAATR